LGKAFQQFISLSCEPNVTTNVLNFWRNYGTFSVDLCIYKKLEAVTLYAERGRKRERERELMNSERKA